MFGSDVLDIVVGMVFVYLLLSLICSALKEFVETMVKHRSKDLEEGIRQLIGDPQNTTDFVAKIYDHPLVNSLFKGTYSATKRRDLPSYIPSASFAMAVMDLMKNATADGTKLPANVKGAYAIFEEQAAGNTIKLQASLEEWFNTGMDRVSGWYKRRAQWILVALGLVIAVAINADTIMIAQKLSNDASLRKELVAMAQAKANQQTTADTTQQPNGSVQQIQQYTAQLGQIGLPIGWHAPQGASLGTLLQDGLHAAPGEIKSHGIGWALTALAISMGAPFWFDLLDKVVAVRTALKPQQGS